MKIIIRIVFGLALLFIVLLIGVQIAVNRPFFREKITKIASEKLHREVTLGGMSLSFFPSIGLNLKEFDIREKNGKDSFVKLDNLRINVATMPLLKKEVEVSSIVLTRPKINVEKDAEGNFNFSDLLGAPQAPSEEKAPTPEAPGAIPPKISVESLKIDDAEFSYKETLPSGESKAYMLKDLDLNIKNFSLKDPVSANLSCTLGVSTTHQKLRLEGSLTAKAMEEIVLKNFRLNLGTSDIVVTGQIANLQKAPVGDLNITSRFLDIADFLALIPAQVPKPAPVETEPQPAEEVVRTGPENPLFGNEIFQKTRFNVSSLFQKVQWKDNTLSDIVLKAKLEQGILDISEFSLNGYDGKVSGVGQVNLQQEKIGYNLGVNVGGIQLEKVTTANLGQGKLQGTLTAQSAFKGSGLSKPDMKSTLSGNAKIEVKEGKVLGTNLKSQLLSKMKNPILSQFLPGLAQMRKEAETQSVKETPFQDFIIDIQVANGIATLQKMNLKTQEIILTGNGQVDFNLQSDLNANAIFSKEFTETMTGGTDLSNLIPYRDGGLHLPVKITGPLTKPRVMPDLTTIIAALAKGQLKGGAEKLLKGGVETLTTPLKKPLEGILGGTQSPQAGAPSQTGAPQQEAPSKNPLKKFKLF